MDTPEGDEPIEIVVPGEYYFRNGSHYLRYEEMLDEACIEGAVSAISKADTLIIGGTSLVVYPAAGLINYFGGKHLVLINKSQTPYDGKADLVIYDSIGKVMKTE